MLKKIKKNFKCIIKQILKFALRSKKIRCLLKSMYKFLLKRPNLFNLVRKILSYVPTLEEYIRHYVIITNATVDESEINLSPEAQVIYNKILIYQKSQE